MQRMDANQVRNLFRLMYAVWTLLFLVAVGMERRSHEDAARELARAEVLSQFDWMVTLRAWAASHGGVYVPANSRTPPNPYLKVPERDITTPSGKKLTLMNPAYLTRQVYSEYFTQKGVIGNLTSLKPINPENQPDPWERTALLGFEKGEKERLEFADIGDTPYLRLMRPLLVDRQCLNCHATQGYKEGEIRGGLSLSVPVGNYFAKEREGARSSIITYLLLWCIGLGTLWYFSRQIVRGMKLRELAGEELKESERGLAEAQRIAHIGSWEMDMSTGILKWSAETCRIYGVEYGKEQITMERFFSLIHPEDRGRIREFTSRTFAPGEKFEVTHRILLAGGAERIVREIGQMFYDNTEKPVRVVGTSQDITAQVHDEERLRLFRTLVDETSDMVFIVDYHTGMIRDANGMACKKLDYPLYELINLSIRDVDANRTPRHLAMLEALNQRKELADVETYFKKRDGALMPVEMSARYVKTSDAEFIVATVRDVTERKLAAAERERAMREAAQLAAAVRHAGEGVVITDAEGAIEYINPVYEKASGYALAEVRGQTPRIFKSGKHDRHFYKELWETIKAGRIWRGRVINKLRDGSLVEEEMTISPITDAAGKIVNFVAVKRDVTREALLEKSRSYFTTITAHELRTPLLKLQLAQSLLAKGVEAGEAGGEVKKVHEALGDSLSSFTRIVNATALIAELTRITGEKPFTRDFIYYDVVTVLEGVRASIAEANRNLVLEEDISTCPRNAAVMGNREMIQQALEEVMSNAVKFTPDGKKIRVWAARKEKTVQIEVADEGEGIPEEKLKDVFIPYYSLENPLTHSTGRYKFHGGGMGLGLTVAKLIVEYHNGTLMIGRRLDGPGTVAVITLPLADEGEMPAAP